MDKNAIIPMHMPMIALVASGDEGGGVEVGGADVMTHSSGDEAEDMN